MPRVYIFLLAMLSSLCLSAQFGNEGIILNTPQAYRGYTLYEGPLDTYLIDNCGQIVHTWEGVGQIDLHPKLLENGNLMYLFNNRIYERDWDNNIVVNIDHRDINLALVYEVIKKSNGNYLCIGRRFFDANDFASIGFIYNGQSPNRVDVIVEIDYQTEEIIWEWNITDHVIQDKVPSFPNYGVVKDHPELINMDEISDWDWTSGESFMINGFDYNAELEQLVLSVRKMNEIVVIDQSTTTAEAKGSTGGRYGKGGDILYRWGNPQNYDQGTEEDKVLYLQHNPNWIEYGPNKGKFIMFNNGFGRPGPEYSSAVIIDQPQLSDGSYFLGDNASYLPNSPTTLYDEPSKGISFYSAYTSGATILPNENIYITVGGDGIIMEIDPTTDNVVWSYDTTESSYLFRSVKYHKSYPAFEGRELVPSGTVENPPSDYNCQYYTTSTEEHSELNLSVRSDKVNAKVYINNPEQMDLQLTLFDLNGRLLLNTESTSTEASISLPNFDQLFLLRIVNKDTEAAMAKLVGY